MRTILVAAWRSNLMASRGLAELLSQLDSLVLYRVRYDCSGYAMAVLSDWRRMVPVTILANSS